MKPINIAILRFDNGHVPHIAAAMQRSGLYNICAICYSNENYRVLKKGQFDGIPKYFDEEELLNAHPEVEAAVCGGTNRMHLRQFRLCAERGIHVLSMKIPTMDLAEYDEMIELEKKSGIICWIELEMRWRADVLRVKNLIESGAIGKPLSFQAFNYSHFPMWYNPWMNDPDESYGKRVKLIADEKDERYRGGALTDHPHIFDLARYILGAEFESVYAKPAPNLRDEAVVEDLLSIVGKMDNGVIFSLDPSYANMEKKLYQRPLGMDNFSIYPRCVEVELAIHGEKGSIIADVYNAKGYQFLSEEDQRFYDWGSDVALFNDTRKIFLMNFAKKIRGKEVETSFTTTLKDHRKIIALMVAAYDSMSSGKMIKLDRE